jgi:hypothetical protein
MLDGLDILELHEAGSRHRLYGLPGRIGDEVEVKPGHADLPAASGVIRIAV